MMFGVIIKNKSVTVKEICLESTQICVCQTIESSVVASETSAKDCANALDVLSSLCGFG